MCGGVRPSDAGRALNVVIEAVHRKLKVVFGGKGVKGSIKLIVTFLHAYCVLDCSGYPFYREDFAR